jgi:penicillin-binding protein 1A
MARLARSAVRFVVVVAVVGALLAAAVGAVAYSASRFVHDVASAKDITLPNLVTSAEVPSVVYAANGRVLATLRSSFNRQPVALDRIAPILIAAVLDTEDHTFWIHGGMDVEAAVRAALADVSAGSAVQGGSTIAQQLVKGTYLTDEKTLTRKVREAVLAERLEQKYTKAQILDAYLNFVYLGNGAYGVQAASREYFGVDADHLNLAQAALLAGLIQAPSGYDPLVNPAGARQRRSEVLSRMVHYKSVTPTQAALANRAPLPKAVHDAPGISYTTYGYYVEEVVNQVLENPALGATAQERQDALFTGGLKIYTNEDPPLESYAEKVAVDDIPAGLHNVAAAFAVIDPRTGNVEALVGGPAKGGNQFDYAVQGERQPGSGFKLFTLIGALEEGYDVYDSILGQSPCAVSFPGVPLNDGYNLAHPMNNDSPAGVVSLVEATALSINCAFLRLAHEVTLPKVIEVARSMGLSDPTLNPHNPSLVLGTEAVRPIEMAAAYATVADGGIYHTPVFVSKILDHTGAVIYDGESPGKRVFSQQVAAEALVALRATVEYGTGTAAALPNADVAGKTGTTENSWDAWFNGITPTLAASVWIGDPQGEVPMYIDGQPLYGEVFGAEYPTQIWHDVMTYALQGVPYAAFPAPDPGRMPPVKYINSPGLERDDLISHGFAPPPTTTTTLPGKKKPKKTTTTLPTTTPIPVTTAPAVPPPTMPPTSRPAPATTAAPRTVPPTTTPVTASPTTRVTTPPTTARPVVTRPVTTRPATTRPVTTRPPPTAPPTAPPTSPPTTAPPTLPPTTAAPTTTPVTAAPTTTLPALTTATTSGNTVPPTTATTTTASPTTATPTTPTPTTPTS